MQVRFSTDDLPPRDRVRFWCDYFAKQAHSITPGEIPDPGAFRAEASGSVAGEFALLDIKSGLERVQRTAADVAKDKTEAFFIRRFRVPVIWRAAPRSTPVDLIHEPGDFCVSSTEWQFDAESKGPASFDMLIIPQAALSPLITGGRLESPVSAARRLAARLAARRSHRCGEGAGAAASRRTRRSRAAQSLRPRGAGVWRLRRGHRAGAGFAAVGAARGGQALRRSASRRSRPDPRQRRRRTRHLGAPAAPAVRAER